LTNEKTEEITNKLGEISTQSKTAFEDIAGQAEANFSNYSDSIDKYKEKTQELINKINTLIKKKAKIENTDTTGETEEEEDKTGGRGEIPGGTVPPLDPNANPAPSSSDHGKPIAIGGRERKQEDGSSKFEYIIAREDGSVEAVSYDEVLSIAKH
jgi:hypothetical protein